MAQSRRPRKTVGSEDRKRDAFYVRVVTGDGEARFLNATQHIGKEMPFEKPRATLAMSVFPDVVAFSLLHLTPRTAKNVKSKPLALPHGSMTRLRRRASRMNLTDNEIVVELSSRISVPAADTDIPAAADQAPVEVSTSLDDLFAPAAPEPVNALSDLFAVEPDAADEEPAERPKPAYQYEIERWNGALYRSSSRLGEVELVDDTDIDLPFHPLTVSVYLRSPSTGRTVAVAFIGHVGKPGSSESMERIAGKVLNSMLTLPEFQILTAMDAIDVPSSGSDAALTSLEATVGTAAFTTQVHCFDDDLNPLGHGPVQIKVDLQNANPSSGKLFFEFVAADSIPGLAECESMLEAAVSATLLEHIGGDGITQITYDILLGGVQAETVHRLNDAGSKLPAVDLTPTRWRLHQ